MFDWELWIRCHEQSRIFLVHDCYIAYNGIHSMSMVNLSCGIHVTLNGECLSSQLKCERKITFRKPTLWLKNHTPKPLLKYGKFPVDWLQFKWFTRNSSFPQQFFFLPIVQSRYLWLHVLVHVKRVWIIFFCWQLEFKQAKPKLLLQRCQFSSTVFLQLWPSFKSLILTFQTALRPTPWTC